MTDMTPALQLPTTMVTSFLKELQTSKRIENNSFEKYLLNSGVMPLFPGD